MLPMAEVFNRYKRVVRDTCKEIGKEAELIIIGGETELDKAMIERLNDPLMHLVRNAVDHGLETPDERINNGKPAKGVITLSAYHESGSVVIEVKDDGHGLDRDRIIKKAIEKGLVEPGRELSEKETYALIFEPGFSTAEGISKLSGRGVGMDVVRRNIESMRGFVLVNSVAGAGTTIKVHLPLTLAIIEGFMVGIASSSYVIPMEMVVKCFNQTEVEEAGNKKRKYFDFRGEVIPYIRLRDVFAEKGSEPERECVVVLQFAGMRVAIAVDRIYGDVHAVIKSLGGLYKNVDCISGATILADGTVAMVLDVPRLVQTVEKDIEKLKRMTH
jgi:two-component system chemotaxis sensor kinase CheA